MEKIRKKKNPGQFLFLVMIAIYLGSIVWINFSKTPSFYDADMYSDILYTIRVWEEKTIFPQNWVFGNQLNVVSAPVLAALFYGISGDVFFSMALASTLMTAAVLWTFDWMLKPALQERMQRLAGIFTLMAVVLYYGSAVEGNLGWSMLFSMCSYYAGYSITAFLAFGCYLRGNKGIDKTLGAVLALTCVLSFGTGIQSIRQTAIMVVPLAAAELLRALQNIREGRLHGKSQMIVAGTIGLSNVAGVACARMVHINQVEIFGNIQFARPAGWLEGIIGCILTIFRMLVNSDKSSYLILLALFLLCVWGLLKLLNRIQHREEETAVVLFFLLLMGVIVIAGIDVLTTMYVYGRYYFLLFPLIAYLVALCCSKNCKMGRRIVAGFSVLLFSLSWIQELQPVFHEMHQKEQDPSYKVSAWMEENDLEYLFSVWGHGDGVAVASDSRIMVAFWDSPEMPFKPVGYLCDLVIFEAEPQKCVYLFGGKEAVEIAQKAAADMGAELKLSAYFEDCDWYLFQSDVNLLKIYS